MICVGFRVMVVGSQGQEQGAGFRGLCSNRVSGCLPASQYLGEKGT